MREFLPDQSDQLQPDISAAKRDLLARYLNGELAAKLTPQNTIVPRPADVALQLSFAQERLWFLDQLMPGSPVFNVPMAVRISQSLDLEILQLCVDEIMRRHEVFRTAFEHHEGIPAPVISAETKLKIQFADFSALKSADAESQGRKLAQNEALRPFDLSREPLVRAVAIKLRDREWIFMVTMHHIVSDGTSILIFYRELAALYDAFVAGRPSPLPELTVQYADYALWQRNWLREDLTRQQISYWKAKLGGDLPVLEIPTDRPRPPLQTHHGARATLTLSEELTRALTELSRRENATLFMTLLAAFNLLLHRYSGQHDIIIGSPISNRPHSETEKLIGFFLNNLALRTDLSGSPTFRELLGRVRRTALDAYANQDVPFEKLLEELKPERDLSRTSIFQVYFNLFSFSDRIELPGGAGAINFVDAWLQSDETLAKFDLTLYAGAGDKEIKLALVYNTDLFSAARMDEMLAQFQQILIEVSRNPDKNISQLSLVTGSAKTSLPDPLTPFPARDDLPITTLFSTRAAARPSAPAIQTSDETWSYAELARRSNQIAHYLGSHGVRKGDVVAIYGHRSAPLVAGILGTLKAGAAFTVLDPAYPSARLIECLRVAQPRGWIQIEAAGAPAQELEQFIGELDCGRLTLTSGTGDLNGYSDQDPRIEISGDDLAYIAFTSGSTGQPKGVMGRHAPLTLFTHWAKEKFGLAQTDRFCMLSGLAHDPLHRDIFTPLQLGGTICIPDMDDLEAPARLRAWASRQKLTVANLTPAMSQLLTDGDFDEQIPSLRYSFLVGDVLTKRDVARLRKLAPRITCVNLYGSTETQRAVGHYIAGVEADAPPASKEILPLGKGIRDVQLLVLNDQQQQCGVGELGEIYFRSPYLARGYLGDQQLTAERFVRNPFRSDDGDRLYRTGDLGRYLPDGNVEHMGRADRQVKIRGYRIEPGEIESVLTKHPAVREAALMPQTSGAKHETILAGYVVPAEGVELTAAMLRDYLSEKLPAYMVPAVFVLLDSLPLTPNGKLDRRALPVPDAAQQSEHLYVAPRSPVEQSLVELWQEVLEIDRAGINDNFFELGGHSLLAVRLFALMEQQFGKRLPLAILFQAPTIAQLARLIEADCTTSWSSLVPIQPAGNRPPFFCVHAVGGNVLEYYDLARHLGPDQPFYGLQSRGLDGHQPPHTRIEDMAADYVREIRSLQPQGPYFIGGRSLGGIIAYEMARQLRADGQEVGLLALLDSYPVGHHTLSPSAAPIVERTSRGYKRVSTHVANLSGLSLKGKLSYLAVKSQYAPVRIKSKIWRGIYLSYQRLGRDVPRYLRQVEQFNWLAARDFVPRVYDGRVTLFWASQDLRAKFDMIEGWQRLSPGGLEIHEIAGTHLDLIKEPYVHDVATMLGELIEVARAACV